LCDVPRILPGLQYITRDKNKCVVTSAIHCARVHEFLYIYITQEKARKEFECREAENDKFTHYKRAPAGQRTASPSQEKQKEKGCPAKPNEPNTS